ncbi:SDR family NAD(P)-dependent oxidoreductase [Micromonospora sp. LOL_021]|uniref:SDR family NAD(P)-dependent oxidoreductase n=1 Tax=Micromonospora sp. LOL_021 TaxID=3345417 RepID=UPI003A87D4E3
MLGGRGAVVTSGSRGIGRAIVRRLVADGATVLFTYRADEAAATEVVRDCGGAARAVRADVAVPAELDHVFAVAGEQLDGLDILVNPTPAVSGRSPDADRRRYIAPNLGMACP